MVTKYYFREPKSFIWTEISFDYFTILLKFAFAYIYHHENGIDYIHYLCQVNKTHIVEIECVTGILESRLKPKAVSDDMMQFYEYRKPYIN